MRSHARTLDAPPPGPNAAVRSDWATLRQLFPYLWRYRGRGAGRATYWHENPKLEATWTIVTAVIFIGEFLGVLDGVSANGKPRSAQLQKNELRIHGVILDQQDLKRSAACVTLRWCRFRTRHRSGYRGENASCGGG